VQLHPAEDWRRWIDMLLRAARRLEIGVKRALSHVEESEIKRG
jgi:hypothetical protein